MWLDGNLSRCTLTTCCKILGIVAINGTLGLWRPTCWAAHIERTASVFWDSQVAMGQLRLTTGAETCLKLRRIVCDACA